MLAALVGALEVPGGTLGTTVRLNRQVPARVHSVKPGPDGFMDYPLNPTDKAHWSPKPNIRNAYRTMVPLAANGPWSQALGPTHFSWMFLDETPKGLPRVTLPDVWFVYRTNPAISFWDTQALGEKMARFPFMVAFAYTRDETNHIADMLLPEATDLESLQLIRIGGSKYVEQFWDQQGFALRQPAVEPHGEARDFTDDRHRARAPHRPAREIQRRDQQGRGRRAAQGRALGPCARAGRGARARGHLGCRLPRRERRGDRRPEVHGLDWWKEHGLATKPFSRIEWYLYPTLAAKGLRFELPYQERLQRIGAELGRRLHEHDMHWWDKQLAEYQALPVWKDFGAPWVAAVVKAGGQPQNYPFWLLTARSMQYAWGANVGMQLIKEVADNIAGPSRRDHQHGGARQARHRRRRWVEIATPQRQRPRPGRAAPGHPSRHAAADRPVRPLGDAVRQGLRHAEPELARDDVARADRRDGLRRRRRARAAARRGLAEAHASKP